MQATAAQSTYQKKLHPYKKDLMDFLFRQASPRPWTFADLGGVWGVDGAYSLYAMDEHQCRSGFLVDTHPTETVLEHVAQTPGLTFKQGNFGEPEVCAALPRLDCIFLFDVLLHQVTPHWDEVLRRYAEKTDCFVIFNQQWIGSATTTRLLDLGPDAYFANTPHDPDHPVYADLFDKLDTKHPDHERTWRDVHHIWQWGITNIELSAVLESLGYRNTYFANHGAFEGLASFENHAFIWRR